MRAIKVYDLNFNPITDLTKYLSLRFIRSWSDKGGFELHINRYSRGVEYLDKDVLLVLSPSKVGIIKHREIGISERGKESENWIFKGPTLKGLMTQRITYPPSGSAYDQISSEAETVMKHYVNQNIVNPSDNSRKIADVRLLTDIQRGGIIDYQSRYKNLNNELKSISQASGLGWNVFMNIDNKSFDFDVVKGKDLSVNQTSNSPVFFSPEAGNIRRQSFMDSEINMKNVAVVGGQGEGVDREISEVGNQSGLSRYETFIDARDINANSNETLTERGQRKLAELSNEVYLEGQILTYSPFVYERDYDLGDIVTVQGWNAQNHTRIIEAEEIHEPEGFRLNLSFGNKKPTLTDKLKSEFDNYEHELKK